MFGSQALEVAIGMALVFFVIAAASSAVVDLISSAFKIRWRHLEKSIRRLVTGEMDDQSTETDAFIVSILGSSAVGGLAAAAKKKPSYIPAKNFAEGVLEVVRTEMETTDLESALEALPANLKNQLLEVSRRAGSDIVAIQAGLEQWFDSAMDRASGVFKRWSQLVLIAVATIVVVMFNVDAVDLGTTLWTSEDIRVAVAADAGGVVQPQDPAAQAATPEEAIERASDLLAPFGWGDTLCSVATGETCDASDYVDGFTTEAPGHILGWIITVTLVSLGAPFWYDALSKLVAIRGTGSKPEKAAGEAGSAQSALESDTTRKPPMSVSDPIANLSDVLTPRMTPG